MYLYFVFHVLNFSFALGSAFFVMLPKNETQNSHILTGLLELQNYTQHCNNSNYQLAIKTVNAT